MPSPKARRVLPKTTRSLVVLFCPFLDVMAWVAAFLDLMEYGVDGWFLCRHDSPALQRKCNIQVVRLEDAHHLTRVEDCNIAFSQETLWRLEGRWVNGK